jgi:hypothetical protein
MTLDRIPPEVGSVWRERRRMYAKRTVVVVAADPGYWGFVYVRTLTGADGLPRDATTANGERRKSTRIRSSLWHSSWEPA